MLMLVSPAFQAFAFRKTMLKKPGEQSFIFGECDNAVSDVAGRHDPQILPQPARAATVIGNRDDNRESRGTVLQTAEQGG